MLIEITDKKSTSKKREYENKVIYLGKKWCSRWQLETIQSNDRNKMLFGVLCLTRQMFACFLFLYQVWEELSKEIYIFCFFPSPSMYYIRSKIFSCLVVIHERITLLRKKTTSKPNSLMGIKEIEIWHECFLDYFRVWLEILVVFGH